MISTERSYPTALDKALLELTRRDKTVACSWQEYTSVGSVLASNTTVKGSRIIFRTWIKIWQCGILLWRVFRVLYHSIYDPLHLSLIFSCRFVRNNRFCPRARGSVLVEFVLWLISKDLLLVMSQGPFSRPYQGSLISKDPYTFFSKFLACSAAEQTRTEKRSVF